MVVVAVVTIDWIRAGAGRAKVIHSVEEFFCPICEEEWRKNIAKRYLL